MENFEPLPLPPLPRHKVKSEPEPAQPQNSTTETEEAELDPEEQLQKMLDEEVPVIIDKPPQCDWHLGPMMSGSYPDPFTLPAVHIAKQSLIHDVAATTEAIVAAGTESAKKDSNSALKSKEK